MQTLLGIGFGLVVCVTLVLVRKFCFRTVELDAKRVRARLWTSHRSEFEELFTNAKIQVAKLHVASFFGDAIDARDSAKAGLRLSMMLLNGAAENWTRSCNSRKDKAAVTRRHAFALQLIEDMIAKKHPVASINTNRHASVDYIASLLIELKLFQTKHAVTSASKSFRVSYAFWKWFVEDKVEGVNQRKYREFVEDNENSLTFDEIDEVTYLAVKSFDLPPFFEMPVVILVPKHINVAVLEPSKNVVYRQGFGPLPRALSERIAASS